MSDWYPKATSFDLFEAIRILQREAGDAPLVGTEHEPPKEPLRFASNVSFAFPASDIHRIEAGSDGIPRVIVNVLGVASPSSKGSLPPWYARSLLMAEKGGNRALRDFFDIFNHRLISLYFRAWLKHNLAIRYELDRPSEERRERASFEFERRGAIQNLLLSLVGFGTKGMTERLRIDPRALLQHPAVMLRRPAPAEGVVLMLETYFGIPFEVESFVPRLLPLEPDAQTRLDGTRQLGVDSVAGKSVMSTQAHFRLLVGPLSYPDFKDLLPGGPKLGELKNLVSALIGSELEYDLLLELKQRDVPKLRLWSNDEKAQRLGWSTWLGLRLEGGNARETIVPATDSEGSLR